MPKKEYPETKNTKLISVRIKKIYLEIMGDNRSETINEALSKLERIKKQIPESERD